MGKFSLIKIDVTSIRLFPYIKDKATMDDSLNHITEPEKFGINSLTAIDAHEHQLLN